MHAAVNMKQSVTTTAHSSIDNIYPYQGYTLSMTLHSIWSGVADPFKRLYLINKRVWSV